jgi:hypothetical protein
LASARIPQAASGNAHAKSTANQHGPVLCIPAGGFPVSVSANPRSFPRFSSLGYESSALLIPFFLNISSHARLGGIHALGLKNWRKHRVLMTKQTKRCTQ